MTAGNQFQIFIDPLATLPTTPAATRLTKVKDANWSPTTRTADSETNEDGGSEAHEIIGDGAELGFTLQLTEGETSHDMLVDAQEARQKINVRYVERGAVTGAVTKDFQASIQLRSNAPSAGIVTYAVTLKKSGPLYTSAIV